MTILSPRTMNSSLKSPFDPIIKTTSSSNNLYGFHRNCNLLQLRYCSITTDRVHLLKPYSSVDLSKGFSFKKPLLGFPLQRKLGDFSIHSENVDGVGDTKKEVVDQLEEVRKETSMLTQLRLKEDETSNLSLILPLLIDSPDELSSLLAVILPPLALSRHDLPRLPLYLGHLFLHHVSASRFFIVFFLLKICSDQGKFDSSVLYQFLVYALTSLILLCTCV